MASSNVDYYARQKELQDLMHEQQQKREQLDRQLQIFCKSDSRLAKLRAAKLQMYWKRICEDQQRSQLRNQNIIREFSRIDSHLGTLTAKTERLRLLKKQYEDYIDRTYPLWREKLRQPESTLPHVGPNQRFPLESTLDASTTHQMATVDELQGQSGDDAFQHRSYFMESHEGTATVVRKPSSGSREGSVYANLGNVSRDVDLKTSGRQQDTIPSSSINSQQEMPQLTSSVMRMEQVSPDQQTAQIAQQSHVPPQKPDQPSPQMSGQADHYVSRQTQPSPQLSRQSQPSPQLSRQTQPSPQLLRQNQATPHMMQPGAGMDTNIRSQTPQNVADVSASDDVVEEMMSQPIQSVTVKGIQGKLIQQRDVESPAGMSQSSGGMEPEQEEEEEEDSEFGSEEDLPLGDQQEVVQQQTGGETLSIQSSPDEDEMPQIKASVQPKADRFSPSPELTVAGLIQLLRFVQQDFPHAISLEGFYRSHPPSTSQRSAIIQKANNMESLSGADSEMVSMVILEQMTLVIRSLRNPCLLPDSMLTGKIDTISQTQIRVLLRDDAQPLWDALFEHLLQLVTCKVMTPNEVAAVFVPCMVSDRSQYQDKAFELLMKLLKSHIDGKTEVTPREGMDSLTSKNLSGVEIGPDGKVTVPPLKFPGSLIERSQYNSDDDTSLMTQSVTSSRIPLNATDAYKNLLTGSMKPQNQDEEEDTDDDVEKQFASALSPRDTAVPAAKIMSDVLSDDSSTGSPAYIPTAAAQSGKSAKANITSQNTGGSIQPTQRKPGIQFQSDLDTDTEMEVLKKRQSSDKEDDDFYDFYE